MYVWQLCWHNSAFLMNSTSTGESPPVDFFWSRYFSYMMKKGIIGVFTVFMVFVWPAAFCECAQLTGTWEYHRSSYERPPQELVQQNIPKGGWQKYDYPDKPPLLGDETCIWLRTTLPDAIPKGAALFFTTTDQDFRIWAGDSLIYQYGEWTEGKHADGRKWHMVMLPDDAAGKELYVQAYSLNPWVLGDFSEMLLNDNITQMKRMFAADIPFIAAIPMTIFMVLVMMIYSQNPVAPKRLYDFLSFFLLEFALWMICTMNICQLILDEPGLWWNAWRVLLYLMPLAANRVVYELIHPRWKPWMRVIIGCFALLMFVAVVGQIAGWNGLDRCMPVFYVMLLMLEIPAFYWTACSAWEGELYCRYMLVPFLAFIVSAVVDGSSMYQHWGKMQGSVQPVTVLALTIFILAIVREQMKRERYLAALAAGLRSEVAQAIERSEIDPLTHCYNRGKFNTLMREILQSQENTPHPLSMIMLDIDHFKRINDTYGHEAGDTVLAGFAALVRQNIKKTDPFVRWGGEEFIIICDGTTLSEAATIAERLRERVAESDIFEKQRVTCSIGVASWHGAHDTERALMARLDTALYQAKNTGRNRVVMEKEPSPLWDALADV